MLDVELSEWTPGDEKLLRAVKHGAVADVETLVVGKGVNPTKVDPNRGTTASVKKTHVL